MLEEIKEYFQPLKRRILEVIMKKQNVSLIDQIIIGSFIVLGIAEASHLLTFILGMEFRICATIMGMGLLLFAVVNIFYRAKMRRKAKSFHKNKNYAIGKFPGWCMLIAGLILFQVIWNYYIQEPYVETDITVETVQTILSTNSIYEINPMTGRAFTEGMPMRLKILVLPVFYATIGLWSNASVQTICYEWIPTLVLLLSYLVYSRWAVYLFPEERKKQCIFLFFIVLLNQFGNYATTTESFLLFSSGFSGEAIRVAVILPYVLLSCLERKWLRAILGAFAELCIVWTFYGLGYSILIIALVILIRFVKGVCAKNARTHK